MAFRRRARAQNFSSDSLLFRNIFGILVIALGALAAVSALSLLKGGVFLSIRHIVQGLGGTLCLGVPLFIIWGGLSVVLSAYRRTPLRAYLLLFLFYMFVLGIINLVTKTPSQTLMEFFTENTENDYFSVLSASYQLASVQGSFGGVLGMLTAWPLSTYVGTVGGVIILSLLSLLCLLFFSRFDFIGSLRQLRDGRRKNKDQRALVKSQQAHLKKLEKQKAEEEKRKRSLQLPAFMRRKLRQDTQARQNQNQPPAPAPARPQIRQTPQQRRPVELYDETIVSEPADLKAGGDAGKMLKRMEEIRRRKAQIARQIGEETPEVIEQWPPVPAPENEPQPQDRYSAYKAPGKRKSPELPLSGRRLDDPSLILPERKPAPERKRPKPAA
ncbi:MAG: hypothetical protein JW811_08755, partial [Clostridiales bacterium]|nr:hypothetical protein [Clostridiales bacterium]